MNDKSIAFLLSFMAGLSTLVGVVPIFINTRNKNIFICFSLAFASLIMFLVSILELIPESFLLLYKYNNIMSIIFVLLFLLVGILSSKIISFCFNVKDNDSLYNVGLLSMIAIILHNIPEGIITFISASKNIKLGIGLSFAIAMHNIPEGVSISMPIYYGTNSKKRAFLYTFISALSEPFGAVITYLFLKSFINDIILGFLFSSIAGIMIDISLTKLLPKAFSYGYNFYLKIFFLLGGIFALIKILL